MPGNTNNPNDATVQPDANTGDVIGAMRASQANMTAMYQLEQAQNNTLDSIRALQQYTTDALKKQTDLLTSIYQLLQRGEQRSATQTASAGSANPAGHRQPSNNYDVYTPRMADLYNSPFDSKSAGQAMADAMASKFTWANDIRNFISQAKQSDANYKSYLQRYDSWMQQVNNLQQEFTGFVHDNADAIAAQSIAAANQETISLEQLQQQEQQAQNLEGISADLTDANAPPPAAESVQATPGPEYAQYLDYINQGQQLASEEPTPPEGMVPSEMKLAAILEGTLKELGGFWENLVARSNQMRKEQLNTEFRKVRDDIRDMSQYALEIQEQSLNKIYSAWDKNLGTVSATMGYTKEAINTLQDEVAQRLKQEGYINAIDAGDYLDELGRVLNANLNDTLATAFAAQSLILEKAVPEIDLTSMAADFGAIYTNAMQQGQDAEAVMIDAMNQVAGAVKAIEQTTEGNNQFIRQVPAYLQQAQTIVARAGGSVDNVASLTTQMMSAEGPLAALAPQLSGFTGELVNILTNQNDSTAVALRAIMHDINTNIGISATDFMTSFMEDTQDTLVTAFNALEEFIEKNENPAARQEFLTAMSDLFGIQGDKLAQLDFGYIGEQLAQTNASLNTSALLDAEALVREGETTTLEEQLVNNTANMLLAENAIRDSLDNALMRKLERNEINMEKQLRAQSQTQAVNLAEDTMNFLTGVKDVIINAIDPLGIFKGINSLISGISSSIDTANDYSQVATWSQVGSGTMNELSTIAANRRTWLNTTEGAQASGWISGLTDGNAIAIDAWLDTALGGDLEDLVARQQAGQYIGNLTVEYGGAVSPTGLLTGESTVGDYSGASKYSAVAQQQQKEAEEAQKEQAMSEAEQANMAYYLETEQRDIETHDNVKSMVDEGFPALSSDIQNFEGTYTTGNAETNLNMGAQVEAFTNTYIAETESIQARLLGIQVESLGGVIGAITGLGKSSDTSKLKDIDNGVQELITLFSTYIEFVDSSLRESGSEGLRMSPSDREQIMGRGLLY